MLSDDEFWAVVSRFDWAQTGDDDAVMAPALSALVELSTEQLHDFDELLALKLFALDTRAHAKAM
jgi:Protein of unknown function (DUF4240)